MVLSDEVHEVELVYAGQEVEITEASASVVNQRQKATLDLKKGVEIDDVFDIGNHGEITAASFGLFAAEKLTAADGKVIPKDGLLEIVSCDENGKHYVDKINRKFPMKTIIIGVAALLVLSVFVVIRMKRDDSSISVFDEPI